MHHLPVLVSRCLCGVPCRYHGRTEVMGHSLLQDHSRVRRLRAQGVPVIPICPEVDGGLTTPRPPTRVVDGRAISGGRDVTPVFERGARLAVLAAQQHGCERAYLLRGSPACDRDAGFAGRALVAAGVRVTRV
jgi:uncharacterized protein YbbK (DUF523 family)